MATIEIQRQFDLLFREVDQIKQQLSKSSPIQKKDWYRPTEVCTLAGISRSKFENLKRDGIIKTQKTQGVVYVSHQELEKIYKPV